MSRMLLIWSLLFGLALAGADWYVEYGRVSTAVTAPSDSEGLAVATDDGTPMPRPPK
jgi:hypothetical protein